MLNLRFSECSERSERSGEKRQVETFVGQSRFAEKRLSQMIALQPYFPFMLNIR